MTFSFYARPVFRKLNSTLEGSFSFSGIYDSSSVLIWHSKEEHIKKLFPDLIEIKMAKRKTVKDLNEEFEVFKDRMNKMERVANLLDILNSDNLKVLEKKVKMISIVRDDNTIKDIEKKVHEHSEGSNFLMMKKN